MINGRFYKKKNYIISSKKLETSLKSNLMDFSGEISPFCPHNKPIRDQERMWPPACHAAGPDYTPDLCLIEFFTLSL